jgi:hypothetical protein
MIKVTKYCLIRDNRIIINGDLDYHSEPTDPFIEFIKAAYRNYKFNYLKFFKMDELCKLGYLASEILLKNDNFLESYPPGKIGVILSNCASSLDTDIKHQKTITDRENYFPSPAVFVYTLANIMIGEICIKHKIYGENAMFVSEKFDAGQMWEYAEMLFSTNRVSAVISGWVDVMHDSYSGFLYLLEKEDLPEQRKLVLNNKSYICNSSKDLTELYNRLF